MWLAYAALLAAAGAAPPAGTEALLPNAVLARYATSLAKLRRPKAITFDYSVEQLGLRNMEQTHHVYRSGLAERDETLIVDGQPLPLPAVRILANRTYRYDIGAIAPTPATYAFAYAGTVVAGDGFGYVFRTERRAPAAFAVSEIQIDSRTFLPSIVRFKIAGYGARGSGELDYGLSDAYWVVREAQVNAHLTSGALAHERITWSNYQFPPSLPPSTFEAPRPLPAIEPAPSVTTAPELQPPAP
jgi:hypothetical protein